MSSRVDIVSFESSLLRGNPLGDPHVRKLPVYLPPSYNDDPDRRYPTLYILSAYMGFGTMLLSPQAWGYSVDERLDRLIAAGKMEECIVVMPDAFTRWGGSQFRNSSAHGPYEDHLIKEIVPYIDQNYRTHKSGRHRGLLGRSSGGYGSFVLAMKFPELFGSFFCSSGDMYFEYAYKPDLPKAYNAIFRVGGMDEFFRRFFEAPKKSSEMITAMNIIAMSAAYSPNPGSPYGIDLPFDLSTGELRGDVWMKWIEQDPVYLATQKSNQERLKKLHRMFFDCGSRDEYNLHIGLRILTKRLGTAGLSFWSEEFDDGHMGTSYRYDIALSLMSKAVSG